MIISAIIAEESIMFSVHSLFTLDVVMQPLSPVRIKENVSRLMLCISVGLCI